MIKLLTAFVLALACSALHAQSYPTKPIRLIVPYPPGGGTDFFARTIPDKWAKVIRDGNITVE